MMSPAFLEKIHFLNKAQTLEGERETPCCAAALTKRDQISNRWQIPAFEMSLVNNNAELQDESQQREL